MTLVLDRYPVPATQPTGPADVRVRRLNPSDAAALDATFGGMSARSRFLRFHTATPRLTPRMRRVLLDIDGRRHVAVVAEAGPENEPSAIGIARALDVGGGRAELAVEVVDAWHRRGVGTLLLTSIWCNVRRLGYTELHAEVLRENGPMRALLHQVFTDGVVDRLDGTLTIRDPDSLIPLAC